MRRVSSWGRLSADQHEVIALSDPAKVSSLVSGSNQPGIVHGMGRSYGDVCLNPGGVLWLTTGLDHFIAFDDNTGRLVCEAGVQLRDIQRLGIPRGWISAGYTRHSDGDRRWGYCQRCARQESPCARLFRRSRSANQAISHRW